MQEERPVEPLAFSSALPGDAGLAAEPKPPPTDDEQPPTTVNAVASTSGVASPPLSTPAAADSEPVMLTTIFLNGTSRTWHAKYFLPVLSAPPPTFLDLPESYFSPTPSELQTAFAGQVKKREELTDRPLLTSKLREREEALKNRAKAAKWPHTRLRVRFEDRSMLEGVFPSSDGLGAVYEFVKAALNDEAKQTPFVLYQSPPRREFVRADPAFKGKSLMDLQFTPSSVFYIKFASDDLNSSKTLPPLLPVLLSSATAFPLPPAFDPSADDPKSKEKPKPSSQNKLGFGGSSGKVTPSWLKIGNKK